ncbi:MAG: polyprenyl synthetase [Deltaproteobacteria bacterium RBG_13_53_10]|nr:MAG: polyprenyl synthetase [Deltaproteobacteria bacterium RBG_13_53_10]
MDLQRYLREKKEIIDSALETYFPKEMEFPNSLHKAIRYTLFSGGKRIRPVLAIAAFEAVGGKGSVVLPFACALEMIHTYSLIHDDLPAIDNDDYRRGRPTCHRAFGETMAILTGDGLLTEAFRVMTDPSLLAGAPVKEDVVLRIVNEVAVAAGILGMVGGQVVDVESEGVEVDLPTLQYIHTHKTGALIVASVRAGARLGSADRQVLQLLTRYGERAGLAFQIADDILNVEGNPAILGKRTGSDLSKRKATYPSLLGLEEAKKRAGELVTLAFDELKSFGPEADPLREIAHLFVSRES